MRSLKYLTISILTILSISTSLVAQSSFELNPLKSSVVISGTSSIHDWEMEVENPSGVVEFDLVANELLEIKTLQFEVITSQISSGNKIMDNKTQDALKASKHKNITFDLISLDNLSSNGKSFTGVAKGTLTIAGERKTALLSFGGTVLNPSSIEVSGSYKLKMSDYNIESPTAMMGTLKTGDEITIDFKILWNSKS